MSTAVAKEFWFVVGSQHLYGEEALAEVKAHAQTMTDALNKSGVLPYPLVLQDLAVSADKITNIMKEVNYRDEVAVSSLGCILSHLQKCGFAEQKCCKNLCFI